MGSTRTKAKQLELLPLESDPEAGFRRQGIVLLAGVDEVGRGPLAGPVVAAAVILPESSTFPGLTDSKLLTPARREFFDQELRQQALAFALQEVGVAEIEELGIWQASLKAMALAVQKLSLDPELVLIDGPWRLPIATAQQPVVKGDQRCLSHCCRLGARQGLPGSADAVLPSALPPVQFCQSQGLRHPGASRIHSPLGAVPLAPADLSRRQGMVYVAHESGAPSSWSGRRSPGRRRA